MRLDTGMGGLCASILVLGLAVGSPGSAAAQTLPDGAARFVEDLSSRAAALLYVREPDAPDERHKALRDLIRNGFDLEVTSQFVLGKFWNRATAEQRAEFRNLFAEYLVNSYVRHLGSFRAETLTVVASHPVGANDVLVETSVEGLDGPASPVWRVRGAEGAFKIIDVSLDGVSLALTQRREFGAVVNRQGLEGLLKLLRDKLAMQAGTARWRPARHESHASLLTSILASPNANRIELFLAGK